MSKRKKISLRRLLFWDLFALLGLLTVTAVMLWALGLLGSVLKFIF